MITKSYETACYLESRKYTHDLVKQNPHTLFVFGDNMQRQGTAGQAVIRNHPNTFGVATKVFPSNHFSAFFRDDDPTDQMTVLSDLDKLNAIYKSGKYKAIAFPINGLGTGLSQMPTKCPQLFNEMNNTIFNYFGINLGQM